MPLSTIFGTETAATGNQLDVNFAEVGALGIIPCVISGTNALTLTPQANTPTVSAYANYQRFSGIAGATSTGTITAQIGALGFLPVYLDTPSGPVAAGSGDIADGNAITLTYDSALNGGTGGFHAGTTSTGAQISGTPTAGHLATWASASSLGDGGTFPTLVTKFFTGSTSFVTPSNTLLTSGFEIIVLGAGGGAFVNGASPIGGGGAGAIIYCYAVGLTPSTSNTITIGAAGTNSATVPTDGGNTSIVLTTSSGTATLTCGGGHAGATGTGGNGGAPTVTGTTTGLSLLQIGGANGMGGDATQIFVPGGVSMFGGSIVTGLGNTYGSGAFSSNVGLSSAGVPGAGLVIVRYVL